MHSAKQQQQQQQQKRKMLQMGKRDFLAACFTMDETYKLPVCVGVQRPDDLHTQARKIEQQQPRKKTLCERY